MSTLTITTTYDNAQVLTEAQLDEIKTPVETYFNTTQIEGANIQANILDGATYLSDDSISADKLASNSVTTAKLIDSTPSSDTGITSAKINTDAVTTAKINDLNVTTGKIANDAVTLGTKTSGNYVATITAGTGISGSSSTEGGTPTIALAAAGAGAATYGSTDDGTKIDTITLDAYGRVTAVATGATMDRWVLEDGDGTEVTITNDKEVKFVEGGGVDINWTDTTPGSDADPYDLTFTVNTSVTAGSGLTGGGQLNASRTLNVGAGTGIDVAADSISVDVSDFMSNGSNNRVVTATGADAMNAEANMTFDGSTLNVAGAAYITGNIGRDTTDYISFSNNAYMNIHINGSNEFRFEADGDFHADGDITAFSSTTASDIKLKTDISVVDNALEKIEQLDGVEFTWIKNGERSAGVIAQDVQEVLPQAVKEVNDLNGDDTHLTVKYDALHALLIEAVKELSARVKELENK